MTTLEKTETFLPSGVHGLLDSLALKCMALVAVLTWAPVIEALRLNSLDVANNWLQLQVGNWIIANHTVPHFGVFSQSSNLPWADPNWGMQLALAILSGVVGLRALPVSVMSLRLLFAAATFVLAGGRRANFWLAVVITVWAQAAWLGSAAVPNALCSATLFAVELILLLRSRDPDCGKILLGIPLLILIWANVDWHFVIGLLALCLFCLANAAETFVLKRNGRFASIGNGKSEFFRMVLVGGLSLLASFISPSSYHSYVTAWQNMFGKSLFYNSLITKMVSFRQPQHYLLMFLAMWAFFVVGKRQARDLFAALALTVNVSLGLALGNEAWIVAVTSAAVIGELLSQKDQASFAARPLTAPLGVAVAFTSVFLIVAASRINGNSEAMSNRMAETLPARACDAIRKNHLPRPIYNELAWGSFLVWYLPEYPVAIDERYELYGEARTKLYYDVTRVQIPANADPALMAARTIIVSPGNGLIKGADMFPNPEEMFRATFPGFHEVYRDDLAVVLSKAE